MRTTTQPGDHTYIVRVPCFSTEGCLFTVTPAVMHGMGRTPDRVSQSVIDRGNEGDERPRVRVDEHLLFVQTDPRGPHLWGEGGIAWDP